MRPDHNSKEGSRISFDNTTQAQYRKYKRLKYINTLYTVFCVLFMDGQYRLKVLKKPVYTASICIMRSSNSSLAMKDLFLMRFL
jgi:hypothetical protein